MLEFYSDPGALHGAVGAGRFVARLELSLQGTAYGLKAVEVEAGQGWAGLIIRLLGGCVAVSLSASG